MQKIKFKKEMNNQSETSTYTIPFELFESISQQFNCSLQNLYFGLHLFDLRFLTFIEIAFGSQLFHVQLVLKIGCNIF